MTLSNMTLLILLAIIVQTQAQFFFQQPFGGFFNQQPAFQPQNLFQPFQLLTLAPPPTTLAPIADPDREVGNFPMPNPRNWPVGPDWNDPRNTRDQQLGWGGNGLVQSTAAPEIAPSAPIASVAPVAPVAPKRTPAKKSIVKKTPNTVIANALAKLKLKRAPVHRKKSH